jgi:hypothetical protein
MRSEVIATAILTVWVVGQSHAATVNLVNNGGFEAGNTGFTSDYSSTAGGNTTKAYRVTTNPRDFSHSFGNFGDHTSGTGNMMVVNGSEVSTSVVWSQNVAVNASTAYEFSFWAASAYVPLSQGAFDLAVNGSVIGSFAITAGLGIFSRASAAWLSGTSTSAVLSLIETSVGFGGNDYALDDIGFVATSVSPVSPVSPVPLPAGAPLLIGGLAGLALLRRRKRA